MANTFLFLIFFKHAGKQNNDTIGARKAGGIRDQTGELGETIRVVELRLFAESERARENYANITRG